MAEAQIMAHGFFLSLDVAPALKIMCGNKQGKWSDYLHFGMDVKFGLRSSKWMFNNFIQCFCRNDSREYQLHEANRGNC